MGTTKRTLRSPASGTTTAVRRGAKVTVHARGELAASGAVFWDTRVASARGLKAFEYTAGVGAVIAGWDQGCLGMGLGERRELVIPAAEGYGAKGFPAWNIPPGATLKFTLECMAIQG